MFDPQNLPVDLDVIRGLNSSFMTKDSKYIDNQEVNRVIINKQEYSGDEK